jgi:hypothetical protein
MGGMGDDISQQTGQQGGAAVQGQPTLGMYGQAPDLAQQRLAAYAPIFQAGAHKLAPGTMEAMTPTEKGLFQSAANASGINPDDFEAQYRRSRLMTNANALAA